MYEKNRIKCYETRILIAPLATDRLDNLNGTVVVSIVVLISSLNKKAQIHMQSTK